METFIQEYLRDVATILAICLAFIDYTPMLQIFSLLILLIIFFLVKDHNIRYKFISGYLFGIAIKNGYLLSYLLGALAICIPYILNNILYFADISYKINETQSSKSCMFHIKILKNDYYSLIIKFTVMTINLICLSAIMYTINLHNILTNSIFIFTSRLISINMTRLKEISAFIKFNFQLFGLGLTIISLYYIFYLTHLSQEISCIIALIVCFAEYLFLTRAGLSNKIDLSAILNGIKYIINFSIIGYVFKLHSIEGLIAFAIGAMLSAFREQRTELEIYPFTFLLTYIFNTPIISLIILAFMASDTRSAELITILIYTLLAAIYMNFTFLILAIILTIAIIYKYSDNYSAKSSGCKINSNINS